MGKRPLTEDEIKFNLKRINSAIEKIEMCDYNIKTCELELETGLDIKFRQAKEKYSKDIRDSKAVKDAELKLKEILEDQNKNGVDEKENTANVEEPTNE